MAIPFQEMKDSVALSAIVGETLPLKRAGHEFKARCPFHPDRTPSFTIDDAKQFFHCFGCGAHGDVFDWLWLTRQMPAAEAAEYLGHRNGAANGHAPPTAAGPAAEEWLSFPPPDDAPDPDFSGFDVVYRHTDIEGRLTRYIARKNATDTERKRFVPFTWGSLNGATGWHRKQANPPRELYGLRDLENPDALVVICEGEKAADAAHALLNLPCLTWSGGANAIHQTDWSPLTGRDIVIWPDNDTPGRKAAEELKDLLSAHAKRVRVFPVADLPERSDAADLPPETMERWFHMRLKEPPEPDRRTAPPKQDVPLLLTMAELDVLPEPQWLIHGLVPEKSMIVPFGPPKSGKTFVVLSAGLHIAAGKEWFGHAVRQGPVFYIAGEGIGGLSLRLRAMRQQYEIGIDTPFFIVRRAVDFQKAEEVDGLIAAVRARVPTGPVAAVIIDTLARAMPGADENSAQEVGLVIAACDKLRRELDCAAIPIHHSGKDLARGARGTSALRGAWDTALEITGSGKRVTVTVADQKEAEPGQRLVFRLESIIVGVGRSSLVPVVDTEPAETNEPTSRVAGIPVIKGQAAILLQTILILTGHLKGAVDHEVLRRAFYEKLPGEEPAARRVAFNRAKSTLLVRGRISINDPWISVIDQNEA